MLRSTTGTINGVCEDICRKHPFDPERLAEFSAAAHLALRFIVDGLLRHFAGDPLIEPARTRRVR